MAKNSDIRAGMQVYGANEQLLGTVERVQGDGFDVAGYHYARALVARVAQDKVYVRGTGQAAVRTATDTGTITVPVAEERLTVGKRKVDLGEVNIRKTITEEERTVPVTLTHEEVHVEERDVTARPVTGEDLFRERTIRVALRGEEAVVSKEAVVTGEVVIAKDAVSEGRQITDTVRKQRVDVDKAYQETRGTLEQEHATVATGRTFAEAEPNYRAGFDAAHDERHAGRAFEEIEPALRARHGAAVADDDTWTQLRQEIRAGWQKATGR